MARHPLFGIALALAGVLILTPDTLLMRLSGMSGWAMIGWRGLSMGVVLLLAWLIVARRKRADLAALFTAAGAGVIVCQVFNQGLFSLGIAAAPVSVVLFGVAAVPVFSALFAWILAREPTRPATWVATVLVLFGIGLAVSGKPAAGAAFDLDTVFGALAGLGVAAALAGSFVLIRLNPSISILLTIGVGALCSAAIGITVAGPATMADGRLWAILVTGVVILPLSFGALSFASRFTQAANVSLILLLETVLGPLWVWVGVGEAPTPRMIAGGAVVVLTLAGYILHTARRGRA